MPGPQLFSNLPNIAHRRRGDTLPDYVVSVFDEDGTPTDLRLPSTPSAVTFTMRAGDDSLKVSASAAVLETGADASTYNRLRFTFSSGDVDEAGTFSAEFELTYASGKRTFPADPKQKLEIQIHDDLDGV